MAVGSISVIRNFMGNAGRNMCNDSLYKALEDCRYGIAVANPKKNDSKDFKRRCKRRNRSI